MSAPTGTLPRRPWGQDEEQFMVNAIIRSPIRLTAGQVCEMLRAAGWERTPCAVDKRAKDIHLSLAVKEAAPRAAPEVPPPEATVRSLPALRAAHQGLIQTYLRRVFPDLATAATPTQPITNPTFGTVQ